MRHIKDHETGHLFDPWGHLGPKRRKLLERVLKEQCTVSTGDDGDTKVTVKPPKEVPADSLQNPSDPDATHDGYKGQGYQAQVMETFRTDEQRDRTTPNLITHVEVQPAHKSDAGAGRLRVRGMPAVRFCVTLKALGLNIQRATSGRPSMSTSSKADAGAHHSEHLHIIAIDEISTNVLIPRTTPLPERSAISPGLWSPGIPE